MNLDDLKKKYRAVSYSDKGESDPAKRIESAFEQIQKEDLRDKKRVSRIIKLVILLALVFSTTGFFLYKSYPDRNSYQGFLLFVLALVVVIPYILMKYRQNSDIRYDLPVNEFIEKVEKRYKLFQPSMLWLIPFLLVIDASFIFIAARKGLPLLETILRSQFFFIMLVVFAFFFRIVSWKKKLSILKELKQVRQMLK